MLCYLPAPYPDELLYSVIARYIVHAGVKDAITVVVQIFGRKMIARVGFLGSLDRVSEHTWPVWQMTGAEIANKLTLFPYYSHFMPDSRTMKCLDLLRSDYCTGLPLKLGLTGSHVKLPRFLRFCKTCRENDLLKYGETYWRRSHQLAGVLVCPEHGEPLIDTNALMQPSGRKEYIDATLITADAKSENSNDTLSDRESSIALKIAIRCREILHGQILHWPKGDLHLNYRRAAIERGFVEDLMILSPSKIETAFVAYYGTLLHKLGCEVPPGVDDSWIRLIVREYIRGSLHPVYNALFQVFLESVPVDPERKIRFGFGPWKCPNPHASHKEEFPVKRAIYKNSKCGIEVDAICGCGLRFSFSSTCDTDSKLPVIDRIRQPGLTWQEEARLLRQCGLSEASLAERMHLSPDTVKNLLNKMQAPADVSFEQLQLIADISKPLLNKKQDLTGVSSEQINEWRREWLKLQEEVPNQDARLARQKNPALYNRLSKYDSDWLYSKVDQIPGWRQQWSKLLDEVPNRSRNLARQKNGWLFSKLSRYDPDWFYNDPKSRPEITITQRIDWEGRDKIWSPMLRAAALKIRSAIPFREISRTAMIKEAGLDPSSILHRLDRLPACKSALNECPETVDEYRERRLCSTMEKACQLGETLTRAQLLRRCGLQYKRLSPRLHEIVERLFKGSGN